MYVPKSSPNSAHIQTKNVFIRIFIKIVIYQEMDSLHTSCQNPNTKEYKILYIYRYSIMNFYFNALNIVGQTERSG